MSALAQSTLVAGSALFVLIDAASRVSRPEPVENTGLGLAVMAVAIAGTLALVAFQRHVVRRTGSQAIAADSLHYKADLATNLSVVASLAIAHWLGWSWVDPLIAALIALYLGGHAFRIGKEAVNVLMDHELPAEKRERIKAIVLAHPEVQGLHDLRTRGSGATIFIELHIEIDAEMTVGEAHDVTDAIEAQLFAAFPEAEVILHQEPQGLDDARLDHRIARARAALR